MVREEVLVHDMYLKHGLRIVHLQHDRRSMEYLCTIGAEIMTCHSHDLDDITKSLSTTNMCQIVKMTTKISVKRGAKPSPRYGLAQPCLIQSILAPHLLISSSRIKSQCGATTPMVIA